MMNDKPERDQNVLSFMMQLVQQKHGDDIDMDFLNSESEKLYDEFGNALVDYFEPLLNDQQKLQFDKLIDQNRGEDQESVLNFLMGAIPNLDQKIQQVLVMYKNKYLQAE